MGAEYVPARLCYAAALGPRLTMRRDFPQLGRHYAVIESFVDFDGSEQARGQAFRCDGRGFAPYDEGHTLDLSGPEGDRWQLRLTDIPGSPGIRFVALRDHLFEAPSTAAPGPLRPVEARLARARIAVLVATSASQTPLEDLAGEIGRWELDPHLTRAERSWFETPVPFPPDASHWADRAASLAWSLGVIDGFRDLDEDALDGLSLMLLEDTPDLGAARSTEDIAGQLAWCAALVELRAVVPTVLSETDDRSLGHHLAGLREAFDPPTRLGEPTKPIPHGLDDVG